jgi:serine transporter
MFFVFSCLFALKASQLTMAAGNNLSVLDILGNASSPILDKLGPLVSILALTTSFFGIFLGYKESVLRLMAYYGFGARENMFFVGTFIVLWSFTTFNVSVLYILGEIGGPLSALFLFLIPVAVHLKHRDRLKEHRGILIFVFCVGMVQLVSYFLGAF